MNICRDWENFPWSIQYFMSKDTQMFSAFSVQFNMRNANMSIMVLVHQYHFISIWSLKFTSVNYSCPISVIGIFSSVFLSSTCEHTSNAINNIDKCNAYLKCNGDTWNAKETLEMQCIPLKCDGDSWRAMTILGIQWKPLKGTGSPGKAMESLEM